MMSFGPRVRPLADSLGGVIHSLCGAPIAAAFTDHSEDPPPLLPKELDAMSRAIPSRQREFAQGRWCARRALAGLGYGEVEIPIGANRAPCWPARAVGSITHCSAFVGAMVAKTDDVRSLGFDVEPATPLGAELLQIVCTPSELARVASAAPPDAGDWAKVIFSAKEAIHKCVSPLYATMLDFQDVTVTFDPSRGVFSTSAESSTAKALLDFTRVSGRFSINRHFVFTCAWINAD